MDIDKASEERLRDIAQIDGARARYLVEDRHRRGRFESWDEVKQVRSYEDGMVDRLQRVAAHSRFVMRRRSRSCWWNWPSGAV